MTGSVVVAILGAEWVAFNLIGVHAVARAAAKRVMAWLLAGQAEAGFLGLLVPAALAVRRLIVPRS